MAVNSDVDICNLAISHLGNFDTVEDIDAPLTSAEKHCARWYEVTRESALRLAIPNFAMTRRIVSKKTTKPAFGFGFSYEYPADALRILGFGDIDAKDKRFNVEADATDRIEIQIDEDFTSGLPLRFIKNILDVNMFTADFKILLSWMLAENIALPIAQDIKIRDSISAQLGARIASLSGTSAQENPPVRKSESKFKAARVADTIRNNTKR